MYDDVQYDDGRKGFNVMSHDDIESQQEQLLPVIACEGDSLKCNPFIAIYADGPDLRMSISRRLPLHERSRMRITRAEAVLIIKCLASALNSNRPSGH